jgi:hypothetical protein
MEKVRVRFARAALENRRWASALLTPKILAVCHEHLQELDFLILPPGHLLGSSTPQPMMPRPVAIADGPNRDTAA